MKKTLNNQNKTNTKERKKKVVITAIAVSAAGILGYFGWQYFKKRRDNKSSDVEDLLKVGNNTIPSPPVVDTPVWTKPKSTPKVSSTNIYVPENDGTKPGGDFPLRRGSKGEKVRALQEALIEKYGSSILPRYGADGAFGAEMAAALKKLKLPASINQTTYNVLVQGRTSTTTGTNTAQKLYEAALNRNFQSALSLLKTIKSKDGYQQVSTEFKNYRIDGVRQTLVNGMLNSFTSEDQKQAIRFEFIRMGLQYDGSKWSLSGLGGLPIITTQNTTVWLSAKSGVKVPGRMLLGNEISQRLDYTLFENNGKYYLVQSKYIKYL